MWNRPPLETLDDEDLPCSVTAAGLGVSGAMSKGEFTEHVGSAARGIAWMPLGQQRHIPGLLTLVIVCLHLT